MGDWRGKGKRIVSLTGESWSETWKAKDVWENRRILGGGYGSQRQPRIGHLARRGMGELLRGRKKKKISVRRRGVLESNESRMQPG